MASHDAQLVSDVKAVHNSSLTPMDHAAGEDVQAGTIRKHSIVSKLGEIVNASGHRDQLQRQYGTLSICGLALNIDNAWIAFGGSLSISLLNGGPPGVLYEFIVSCVYYGFIGASIAELASSIPSSGGVYHWASITPGPKYGRAVGFFTGCLNWFGWIFDLAAIIYIPANVAVSMYAVYNSDYEYQPWHPYVAFVIITWICTFFVIFCNRLLAPLQHIGLFMVIVGGLVTIICLAVLPSTTGSGYASNSFVWTDFQNQTGWIDGVCFLTGVLNGAFTIGTPDAITHMAEELPNPKVDLPKAVFAQVGLGFITAFVYGIALMYGISDLDAVVGSAFPFPLTTIYAQATGTAGGTFGLLFILFLSIMICSIGTTLMVGRLWWSLARDNVVPFSGFFSRVNEKLSCPIEATVWTAIMVTGLGAIQLGSKTAFSDLVGSFIILTTLSYFLAFFPNILTGRKNIPRGYFYMGKFGYLINGIACVLIIFFNIMFCFPYAYPVDPISLMNWNSVILVGCLLLTTIWWLVHGLRKYPGPKLSHLYLDDAKI